MEDPIWGFSCEGLGIYPALAGDYEISILDYGIKVYCIKDHVDATYESGIQERNQSESQTSCGTGTWGLRIILNDIHGLCDHLREMLQAVVQTFNRFSACTFLRGKDMGSTFGAV